jgi:beta-lactamase class A
MRVLSWLRVTLERSLAPRGVGVDPRRRPLGRVHVGSARRSIDSAAARCSAKGLQARALAVALSVSLPAFATAAPPAASETLAQHVNAAIAVDGVPLGHLTVYAKNLDTGAEWSLNGDERIRTASTIKLPIACALEALANAGRLDWQELLVVRADDQVSGSGVLHEFTDGATIRLKDAMTLMLIVSDNTATNLLLDRVGGDRVNDYLDRLGFQHTRVLRKIRGDGAHLKPPSGWTQAGREAANADFGIGVTTEHDMVRLLEMLANGEIVNRTASDEVLAILSHQQDHSSMARHAEGMRVLNKTGSLDALRSDVGIAYTPRGRIAMAITIDGLAQIDESPDNAGEQAIWSIADLLMRTL